MPPECLSAHHLVIARRAVLAYVFRHWPDPSVAIDAYEAALLAFYRRAGGGALPGFHASAVCRDGIEAAVPAVNPQ